MLEAIRFRQSGLLFFCDISPFKHATASMTVAGDHISQRIHHTTIHFVPEHKVWRHAIVVHAVRFGAELVSNHVHRTFAFQ
jgi:hypothetical protein